MKTLQKAFRFYVHSNIHVAIAVMVLTHITYLKFEIPAATSYLYASFFGAITAYTFVKYGYTFRHPLSVTMKYIWLCALLSMGIAFYYAWQLPMHILLCLVPFGILTLVYVFPVLPKTCSLRSVAGIKVFIIAMVWTGVTVLVPVMYLDTYLPSDVLIEMGQRFMLIIVLMLPFEIRDLQYDVKELATIPQQIGVFKTKVLGSVLLVIILVTELCKSQLDMQGVVNTGVLVGICMPFVWTTAKKQSEYYASFWVESIPIYWWIVMVVVQQLFR